VPNQQKSSSSERPDAFKVESDRNEYYYILGIGSAAVGLFFLPELLDSLAIVVGAYLWRREAGEGNRGLGIVILGILCMLVGLYFTSVISLGSLLHL
jgi:hypothetical protein